jgi:putative DNA primase/helicase
LSVTTGEPTNEDGHGVSFDEALSSLSDDQVLGYRHQNALTTRLALIDCDSCVSEKGVISETVQKILRELDAHAEYSISGTGIHVLCWILSDENLYPVHKHRATDLEFYWARNTIPITGYPVYLAGWSSPKDVPERTDVYLKLHQSLFADYYALKSQKPSQHQNNSEQVPLTAPEILFLLFGEEESGTKWQAVFNGDWEQYYPTASHADFNLLMKLAFYSCKDRQLMDEIFSSSLLSKLLRRGNDVDDRPKSKRHRPKWESLTYRNMTLDNVLSTVYKTYSPKGGGRS